MHRVRAGAATGAAAVEMAGPAPFADGDEGQTPTSQAPQRVWAANCSGRGLLAAGSRSS